MQYRVNETGQHGEYSTPGDLLWQGQVATSDRHRGLSLQTFYTVPQSSSALVSRPESFTSDELGNYRTPPEP